MTPLSTCVFKYQNSPELIKNWGIQKVLKNENRYVELELITIIFFESSKAMELKIIILKIMFCYDFGKTVSGNKQLSTIMIKKKKPYWDENFNS